MSSISELLAKTIKEDISIERFSTKFHQENSYDWCTDHNEELDMYVDQSDWLLADFAKEIGDTLRLEDIGAAKAFLAIYGGGRQPEPSLLEAIESIESDAKIFASISGVDSIIADLELVGRSADVKKMRDMQLSLSRLESKEDLVDEKIAAIQDIDFSKGNVEDLLNSLSFSSALALEGIETHKLRSRVGASKDVSTLRVEMMSNALSGAIVDVVGNAKKNAARFELVDISHLRRVDRVINGGALQSEIRELVKLSEGQAFKNQVFEQLEAEAKEEKRNQMDNMWVAHEVATARYKDKICEAKERLASCSALDMFLDRASTTPARQVEPVIGSKKPELEDQEPEKALAVLLRRKP